MGTMVTMSCRTLSCAAILVALCAAPRSVHADLTEGWYGYEIMVSDLTSLTCLGIGLRSEGNALSYVGAAGIIAVPPVIHLLHGRGKGALLSLGMRAIPAINTLRYLVEDDLPVQGALLWFGLGLGGMVIDWTFNAFDNDEPAMPTPRTYGLSYAGTF